MAVDRDKMLRLNSIRAEKGLTVSGIANALGVPKGSVGCWFNGVYAMPEKYAAPLAKLLNVPVADIPVKSSPDSEKSVRNKSTGSKIIGPKAFQNTFWNVKRVQTGYTLSEVAKVVGCSDAKIARFFCGMAMPKDEVIKIICDLCEVDFVKGKGEFQKAYNTYKKIQGKAKLVCYGERKLHKSDEPAKKSNKKSAAPKVPEVIDEPMPPEVIDEPKVDIKTATLTILYGILSYKDFMTLSTLIDTGCDDILSAIYGKVDFDLFTKIKEVLNATN